MNPLILSLVCLLLVGVSANWLSIVKINVLLFLTILNQLAETPTNKRQTRDKISGFI